MRRLGWNRRRLGWNRRRLILVIVLGSALLAVGCGDPRPTIDAMAVVSHYALLADGGLVVVDMSNPEQPNRVAFVSTPGHHQALVTRQDLVVAADGPAGLHLFDLEDPAAPRLLGQVDVGGYAWDVALTPTGMAYVATGTAGVAVVDLSEPSAPRVVGRTREDPPVARAVAVHTWRDWLAVADIETGLRIYHLEEPANPVQKATILEAEHGIRDVTTSNGLLVAAFGPGGIVTADPDRLLAGLDRRPGATDRSWTLDLAAPGSGPSVSSEQSVAPPRSPSQPQAPPPYLIDRSIGLAGATALAAQGPWLAVVEENGSADAGGIRVLVVGPDGRLGEVLVRPDLVGAAATAWLNRTLLVTGRLPSNTGRIRALELPTPVAAPDWYAP